MSFKVRETLKRILKYLNINYSFRRSGSVGMQNVCSNEKKVLKILCGRNHTTCCSESFQVTYKLVNSRSIGKFSIKKEEGKEIMDKKVYRRARKRKQRY
jgi:hypothetical protein